MTRKTIFRSNTWVWFIGAALCAAPNQAAAQDTTFTVAEGRYHIVRTGETLWALAEYYLGDPLLWPEIYRINPAVVEDPHWIFPGERLALTGLDSMMVAGPAPRQTAVPASPSDMRSGSTIFARNRSGGIVMSGPRRSAGRVVQRQQFYSAGFLTEQESMPWADLVGATDQSTFGTLTEMSAATLGETLLLTAPGDANYQIGDSLLVARLLPEVDDWGHIVDPTGVVQVTAVDGREVAGRLILQFSRVADGQFALPLEPFVQLPPAEPVAIENGMRAQIITTRDGNPVTAQHDVVFIDVGQEDGVVVGDIFEVLLAREFGNTERRVGLMQIVHVRHRSASAMVFAVEDLGIARGAPVRLIQKMST